MIGCDARPGYPLDRTERGMTDIRSTTRSTQSDPERVVPPLTWERSPRLALSCANTAKLRVHLG
jgi:hypothetical protein